MVEKYKAEPFALLGVHCEGDKDAALAVMANEKITWPTWNDGQSREGPIQKAYHVRGYPATFVLDANGVIRHIGPIDSSLEVVDDLLAEMTGKRQGK